MAGHSTSLSTTTGKKRRVSNDKIIRQEMAEDGVLARSRRASEGIHLHRASHFFFFQRLSATMHVVPLSPLIVLFPFNFFFHLRLGFCYIEMKNVGIQQSQFELNPPLYACTVLRTAHRLTQHPSFPSTFLTTSTNLHYPQLYTIFFPRHKSLSKSLSHSLHPISHRESKRRFRRLHPKHHPRPVIGSRRPPLTAGDPVGSSQAPDISLPKKKIKINPRDSVDK